MANRPRGLFVVLEGIDQSGKTTACHAVVAALAARGVPAAPARFPDRSVASGKMIQSFLDEHIDLPRQSVHLLYSANRWQCLDTIRRNLAEGVTVVCDRYAYSGVVYSVANGLDREWCMASDRGLVRPDVVVYLRLTPEEAATRRSGTGDRYETVELQRRVFLEFERMQAEQRWCVVDATAKPEEVAARVLEIIEPMLGKAGALETLW